MLRRKHRMILHPFPPLFSADSRTLILGSFPSVKSREAMFFYGHKQNRFWRVIASLYGEAAPETVEEKKVLILSHGLALWDSVAACTITGSSDASITDVIPTDLASVLAGSRIDRIFCNGAKSYEVYCRWQRPVLGIKAVKLPSTSPANAACSFDRLLEAWRAILPEEADPL